ncbi:MAG: sugar-binding protein [Saprospiraceae bacterium]|nr:CBM9 family sugar-binding protein [Saprospiraceae bacterium]MDW8229246.1 sugar-binding protein [Saprospiraceae bacterium]
MPCRVLNTLLWLLVLLGAACQDGSNSNSSANSQRLSLNAAYGTPVVDGSGADAVWENLDWQPIDQPWQRQMTQAADFKGRYKVAWDENNLYFLVEVEDDSLTENALPNIEAPRLADCLILFIDEDASGGDRAGYNAFVYHIPLDGRIFNAVPDSIWQTLDDHCWMRHIRRDNTSTWEIALRVYDGKQYRPNGENIPKLLKEGKKIGFALAYGDRDSEPQWENIIGNIPLNSQKAETAWQNTDSYLVLNLLR